MFKASVMAISISCAFVPSVFASNSDWQPISSERLIKLPTNVMERALEHDFQNSLLASKIKDVDTRLGITQGDMTNIKQSIKQAEGEQKVELRHQFLEQKSSYIDHMEARQGLRRDELKTRMSIYQGLLGDMKKDQRRAQDPVSAEVREKQRAARARMENVAEKVDSSLFEMAAEEQSQYAQEYGNNLQKIKQLQLAIRQHSMHRNVNDGAEQLTREAYIRQLLSDAEADLALLNQEDEMLSYMARLVAMDAQSLQIELTYGSLGGGSENQQIAATKPANMVDFFTP
jgi:hypothetical protein